MNMVNHFGIVVISFVLIAGLYEVVGDEASDIAASEAIRTANEVLSKGCEILTTVNDIISPLKAFAEISSLLGVLGPAGMIASSVISIVTMFLPKEDSPELKAIKAGFEKVNNKLDIITSKMGQLENIIELSSAKSALINSVTAINGNYEALEEARKFNDKESYHYFAKLYEQTFNLALDRVYELMFGSSGSLGFDIVNLYKVHVKCNPKLLSDFCTKGLQLIVKGMEIEGAYMGYYNYSSSADRKANIWKSKMQNVVNSCQAKIKHCESNWETYANQQFRETYKEIGGSNEALAQKIVTDLNNVVPHRNWVASVHNDVDGFGNEDEAELIYYKNNKIMDENKHDVYIASTPKTSEVTPRQYDQFMISARSKVSEIEKSDNCRLQYQGARFIRDKLAEIFHDGFIYVVNNDFKPGLAASSLLFYKTDIRLECSGKSFQLAIFQ